MNKEFTVQNFKSASSNASDYLKGKSYDVPRGVMLNMLSVFLGAKNWNTLEAQLSQNNIVKNNDIVKKRPYGLTLVISKDKEQYIKYINNVLLSSIVEKNEWVKKILHYKSNKEISICLKGHPDSFSKKVWGKDKCYDVSYIQSCQNYPHDSLESICRNALRRAPDVICLADLNPDMKIDSSIFDMVLTGHVLILGMQANDEDEAKAKIIKALLSEGSVSEDDIRKDFDFSLQNIINLNK